MTRSVPPNAMRQRHFRERDVRQAGPCALHDGRDGRRNVLQRHHHLADNHAAVGCAASERRPLRSTRWSPTSSRGSNELKLPCVVRAGAPAEIHDRSFPSPMQGGRTWDQRRGLTNGDSLVLQPALTGRGSCDSGAANFCSGGAAVARQAHNQEVVGSIPTPATSSGDGLGIQQPGSMTWGGFFVPTAPSGRADESAMCPAVARSFEGRAA